MKTLEFIFRDTKIHFLLQKEGEVMVNATDLAKAFGKRTDLFLKSKHAKIFIAYAKSQPNGGQIMEDRGRNGMYFERRLALKFAAWLDVELEYWVFSTIDNLLFGNYKKHWEAHARQEAAKLRQKTLKEQLLTNPSPEIARKYFEATDEIQKAKTKKQWAIKNQLEMFDVNKLINTPLNEH